MIQYMNVHMMEAFTKVVEYIVLGTFPIRRGDYREFRQYLDVLFQVVNPHVSLTTKRSKHLYDIINLYQDWWENAIYNEQSQQNLMKTEFLM